MSGKLDRREFACFALGASLFASGRPAKAEEQSEHKSEPQATEPRDPAAILREYIERKYPSEHLTDEILAEIEQDIRYHQYRSSRLKSVLLKNGDAPFVFSAYRNVE